MKEKKSRYEKEARKLVAAVISKDNPFFEDAVKKQIERLEKQKMVDRH
jgi:hypothetical protein